MFDVDNSALMGLCSSFIFEQRVVFETSWDGKNTHTA